MMMPNTGSQLPVASCNSAASGPRAPSRPLRHVQEAVIGGGELRPEVSVKVEGNSEKISPSRRTRRRQHDEDQRVVANTTMMRTAAASIRKARAIVFSRPIWSDSQPKNGRVKPLVMRSTVKANGNAARPNTRTFATPKSREKAANCEMIINPPVDIIVIIANSSQNTGARSICRGATSRDRVIAGAGGSTSPAVRHAHRQRRGRADEAGE